MPKKKTTAAAKEQPKESKFSKSQLLAANIFRDKRDLLNALLSNNETYTVNAVKEKIKNYMKGQVK